ncbi:hypothetical protein BAUCODRAFT_144602 [Baudoinia panamericana UAMH 10762]|uniref:Nuclear pore complex protein Nup160 n=1 Tax=Baudoinia panamericana (strain UAMH 10762) TaxID=717646 RepID=M2NNF8_BAUPA|nr:uncharacterized protein BAUCODRAFT_144602 [Baudoinia panamericana UAMH 10762]EMD01025.1 hypothetical protein BAUCODRAFT_144602 [Baudoinia panamericana UAMH 10762]
MAQAASLYRRVPLAPSPVSPSHVLHIDTSHARTSSLRAGTKRPFDAIDSHNEESYTRAHLATDASIFFRSTLCSPRSILWRMLDERQILEIQAVDLVKRRKRDDQAFADSWLTFRINCPDGIVEQGVAFADAEETDALEAFVLTKGKELLTITLKRDLLTRPSVPAEFDPSTCVNRYTSSFLSVRQPYRFFAVNNHTLLISLTDGGLVRLERSAGTGAQWRETFFSEGGWRGTLTLKGFNPFAARQSVRYGQLELEVTTIVDMAESPDGKYVWTVSLDYKLRAWSTASGQVVFVRDLLGVEDRGKQHLVMAAEQGRLLQIVTPPSREVVRAGGDENRAGYAVAVHSPKEHRFRIYEVTQNATAEGETIQLRDLAAGTRLVPPFEELMNTNIWLLESFYLVPGTGWASTQLWIQARSGALCRTFKLTFDLLSENGEPSAEDLADTWSKGWSVVGAGAHTTEDVKRSDDYPGGLTYSADSALTPSERWLAYLFRPNRFSHASLETALHVYCKARGASTKAGALTKGGLKKSEQPLEERLVSSITSKVLLHRLPNEQQPDYARYRQDIQAQWVQYHTVLMDLHARRQEVLALAFDTEERLPWVVCSDFVASVRALSSMERRSANTDLLFGDRHHHVHPDVFDTIYPSKMDKLEGAGDMDIARLLHAARELRRALSTTARTKFAEMARTEALNFRGQREEEVEEEDYVMDESFAPHRHALAMFDKCNLETEISDEDFDVLSASVDALGGLGSLPTSIFLDLLSWLDERPTGTQREGQKHELARYGAALTVQITEEFLAEARGLLLDVLVLVSFMAGGLEPGGLDEQFRADTVFEEAMGRLKRTELLMWLVSRERGKRSKLASSDDGGVVMDTVTLFEDICIPEWEATWAANEQRQDDMPTLLTQWTAHFAQGLLFEPQRWPSATAHILSHLIKAEEVDLATEFLQFSDRSTDWLVYLTARLYLLRGDYTRASLDFRAAASDLAVQAPQDTAHLIPAHEAEGTFASGSAAYYQHVMALFEKMKIYSYVADFAYLALQHTDELPDLERSMAELDQRKSAANSPAMERLSAAEEETRLLRLKDTRDEMLNRLFNALVLTGRYADAYGDALTKLADPALKKAGLKKLVEACVKSEMVPVLLALPFDEEMGRETDKGLAEMARKELAAGGPTTTLTPAAYQILYAFRTQRSDFRGAAEILHEYLQMLLHSPAQKYAVQDPEDETVLQCYALLINTLVCCGEEDAWVLAQTDGKNGAAGGNGKRRLVTLADVRGEYGAEMDRRSEVLLGRFPLVGGGG